MPTGHAPTEGAEATGDSARVQTFLYSHTYEEDCTAHTKCCITQSVMAQATLHFKAFSRVTCLPDYPQLQLQ